MPNGKHPLRNLFKKKKPPVEPIIPAVEPEVVAPTVLQPIPPEGIKWIPEFDPTKPITTVQGKPLELHILEDFEYVGTERRLRSKDYIVYAEGKEVGRISHETGELAPKEIKWWAKTLGIASEILFAAPRITGMTIRGAFLAPKLDEAGKERFEARAEVVGKEMAMGELAKAEFEAAPWYEQIAWESPFWAALGVSGISAIKGRAALAPLPGVVPKVARAALLPAEVYEKAVATGLRYGIGVPLKGISTASRKAFEKALDLGLDKWLVRQGIRGEQASRIVRFFLEKNNRWLYQQAETSIKDKLAKRIAATQAGRVAANDVVKAAEPMLRDAVKSVTGKELVTAAVAPTAPAVTPIVPTVQGLVDKGKVEFDRLAATGRIAPFGGDIIEEQTANELKAVAEGRKPIAYIAGMDAAEARKLGLVVKRVTMKGEKITDLVAAYAAYKKGNIAAFNKLSEVFAKEVTGELKGAEFDVALGEALGYSEADIAKYLQSVHGSYEEFVKATKPEVPAVPEVPTQIDRLKSFVESGIGEVPSEITYFKAVGGYAGIVKWKGKLYRMSEVSGINAAHLGMLGGAGVIKVTRVPSGHAWAKLFNNQKEWRKLPLFGERAIMPPLIEPKPPAVEVAKPPVEVIPTELTEQEILRTTPIGKLKVKEVTDVGIRDIVNKIKGIDIKALPLEYKTKIREILNDFDVAFRTKKTLTKRASLRAYIERLKADGIEVTVPQSYIDVAYKTSLADMTTEQVQMLHDMVQSLAKMGSLKNKLLRVQAGRRVDEAEKAIVDHLGVPPEAGVISKAAFEEGWSHQMLERYKGFITRTDRMERILLSLDGYEPNGLMWQTFYDPINAATDQKLFGVQKTMDDFRTFLKEQDIDIKRIISVRKEVVPGVELTSSERIGVYLHSLNKDNLAHLKYGNKIDEKTIEAVINQMTPDEIAVAEYLGSYFRDAAPSVSKIRTDVEGKSLDVVENYFPIILERRATTTFMSQERKLIEAALQDFGKEMSLEDEYRFTSKWASARIAKQFIRQRTHRALQPVSLDALEIFIRRAEAMEHYKAFAPPVRDLQLLLNRADVQKAIVAKGGRPVLQVMNQWLKDVAKTNPLAVTSQGEQTLRTLRVNAVTAVLGINITTALKQIPSMLIGAAEIGNVPALKGMFTFVNHPIETRKMIKDLAPQIYRRSIERELAEAKMMRNLEKRLTDRLSPREAFMWLTVTCDKLVVSGLWRGAFEDFLKKNPGQVNEAAKYATAAIRRTQPFFSIKDLPEYWRSGEFMKALTMFTNQLNQYWNYYRHDTFGAAAAGKVGFGTVVKRVLEGFVLSAIIIGWITRSRPPQDAKDIMEDLASMAFATFPIVGHFIVGGYQGFHSDSGLITTEVMSRMQEVAYYMNKGEWDKAALAIPELGGYLAGIPVAQPKRVIEALINIASGKTDDWLEIIWGSYRREEARKEEEKPARVPGIVPAPEDEHKLKDLFK